MAALPRMGYARVSAPDQDPGIQVATLEVAGCGVIRAETGLGASREGRGELETVLDFLRAGDGPVVHRLDRLGRSTRDVPDLVHGLDGRGASLRVLEPDGSTAGDPGRPAVTVLGMVADMEPGFIRDRQRAGIGAAKRRGVYRGRRKRIDDGRIREPAARQVPKARIARELGISRMSVYRALRGEDGWGAGMRGRGSPESRVTARRGERSGQAGAALVPGPGRSGGWRPPECANGNRPVGQVAPAA